MKKKVKGQANKTPMPHIVPKFDIGAILDVERAKKPLAVVNEVKNVGITEAEKQQASSEYIYYHRADNTRTSTGAFHDSYAHARHGDYIQTLIDGTTNGKDFIAHLEILYKYHWESFEKYQHLDLI